MPAEPAASAFLGRPASGRLVERQRKVRLGDVDRGGRLRLDATARYLQDVATDDADDAGLDRRFGWLVRRTTIRVTRPATLGEWVTVATWCTGIGRAWAERRTELVGHKGAHVDAVSLWVQIDTSSARPAVLDSRFSDAYGEACAGRKVSARLRLEASPTITAAEYPWQVRSVDLDPFGHVNNAATWAVVEQHLPVATGQGTAELEYPQPITATGTHTVIVVGQTLWIRQEEAIAAIARWTPHRPGPVPGPPSAKNKGG